MIIMHDTDQRLDRLNALLNALPLEALPLTLSELDGFVTGVLACPEHIPASDWLPHVWGDTGEAGVPGSPGAEDTIRAVTAHHDLVAAAMRQSLRPEPIYDIDPAREEAMWEPWVDGFTRAMGLRPDAWNTLLDQADTDTRSAMIFLVALHDIYTGKSTVSKVEVDKADRDAPKLIPACVAAILRRSRPDLAPPEAANLPGAPKPATTPSEP
jgi:uncharacterized protein